jgi:N-acetylmuramoyl-L-alanine amidase
MLSAAVAAAASPTADAQKPLAGKRIALDPGHGPRGDEGAVYIDPNTGQLLLSEAEFNLDVGLRLRDLLVAKGADVVMTRETADTFTAPWPVDANGDGIVGASGDDLQERIDIFNNFHSDVFLSIHANSLAENRSGEDLQVIYCGGSDCGFPTQSKQLAQLVLGQLKTQLSDVGYNVQGAEAADDLAVDSSNPPLHMFLLGPANPPRHVRAPQMPGVLGETLYVTNPTEAPYLKRDYIRQAIALGYADGLQAYLTGR